MKEKRLIKKTRWNGILLGIVFISAAAVCFANKPDTLGSFSVIFGLLCIARGLFTLSNASERRGRKGYFWRPAFVCCAADLIIGLLFIIPLGSAAYLRVLSALLFLTDSAEGLLNSGYFRRRDKNKFYVQSAAGLLGAVIGAVLISGRAPASVTLSAASGIYYFISGGSIFYMSMK